MTREGSLLCVALGALLASACRAQAPLTLSYDFAEMAPVAEREAPWRTTLLGTPEAARDLGSGFLQPTARQGADPFAWSQRTAEVMLRWPDAAPRQVVLDLEPYPGLARQAAEAFLNDKLVGRLELERQRRRYLLQLPVGVQWSAGGENRLRLEFEASSGDIEAYGRPVASALYALLAGPASPSLATIAAPGAPPPLSVVSLEGVPGVIQAGPSALRFALRLPERAELRFVAGRPDAAPAGATLRVTLEDAAGEREVWRGAARATAEETRVALPGGGGGLVRIGLHVDGDRGGRAAWALWKAPRLFGDAPATAVAPDRAPNVDEARLSGLRRALGSANVMLLVLDAAGAKHLGCYGYGRRTTPEIDRIASEGVLFEEAFTPAAYTLAAVTSIFTSQSPDRHQNLDPRRPTYRRARVVLPELLRDHGVRTGGFVANSMAGPAFGFERGFDDFSEVYAELGRNATAFREVLPAWLKAHRDRRFFAYVHYREPHFPYDPEPPFDTLFGPEGPIPPRLRRDRNWFGAVDNRRIQVTPEEVAHAERLYDGNLAAVDQELGFLRRTLEELGLWERTLVIITADHGEAFWEHEHIGHSVQLYEPILRIPLVLHVPGGGHAGVRIPGLTDLLDLAPTIADVFGVRGQGGAERAFEGRTLLPMLLGGPGKGAVVSRTVMHATLHALRDARYKLIYGARVGQDELYDLEQDPGEKSNLTASDPRRAALYRQALHRRILDLTRETAASADGAKLTRKQLENLRALGYVQ